MVGRAWIPIFFPINFVLLPPGPVLPEEKIPPVPGAAGPVWVVLPPPEHREGSLTPQLGLPRPVCPLMKEKYLQNLENISYINYFSVLSQLEINLCTIAMILFILQETANSAGAEENIFLSTAMFYININFI